MLALAFEALNSSGQEVKDEVEASDSPTAGPRYLVRRPLGLGCTGVLFASFAVVLMASQWGMMLRTGTRLEFPAMAFIATSC